MNAPVAQASLQRELKKYSGKADRVLKLLIAGCKQEQAAKAVGVDPSFVSQLCSEEDFQLHLAQHIRANIEKAVETDDIYDNMEVVLAKRVQEMLPFITSLDQAMRMLAKVNELKRKTQQGQPIGDATSGGSAPGSAGLIVNLILPPIIRQHVTYEVNPNNEVVSVEGQEMVTLNSSSINSLVSQEAVKQKLIQVANQNVRNQEADSPHFPNLVEKLGVSNGHERSKKDEWSDL